MPREEIALSVGFFDGFHLGHQQLVQRLIEVSKELCVKSVLLSFSNHPSTLFTPENPRSLITPTAERRRLLEKSGVDKLIWVDFNESFAKMSAREFISSLPIKALILGHDATIGSNREGNQKKLEELAKELQFHLEYMTPFTLNGELLSSSALRKLIRTGDFEKASRFLGREYSLTLPVTKGIGVGKGLGFSTANMQVDGLALPPQGVYITSVKINGTSHPAVANLGIAPSVRTDGTLQLEVHLLSGEIDLKGKTIEVLFHQFLREEKHFESLTDLKTQIAQDVAAAKAFFTLK